PVTSSALHGAYDEGAHGAQGAGAANLRLAEHRGLTALNLQGEPDDAAFIAAAKLRFGVEPPRAPNTTAAQGRTAALWLGPGSWLVVLAGELELNTFHAHHDAIAEAGGALTDVSHGRTVIRIAGKHAADVLGKGCGLDLHPRHFKAGACAQTVFARLTVLIHKLDDAHAYEIYAARSYAAGLWHFLHEASAEFGFEVVPPIVG
ncbi:MAG: hypothetical protein HY246_15945, partial [Proteobacteria bacterium]|nr:hypothetical protein [Pseudomonadota bacterium]